MMFSFQIVMRDLQSGATINSTFHLRK